MTLAGAYGMGKTRLAAELARHCPGGRRGALRVRLGAARGRARGDRADARRAAADAARARRRRPRAGRGPRALRDLGAGPRALVLATGLQPAALGRLEPRESLVLEPLDADGVRAIAALYAPAGSEIPVDDAGGHEPRRRPRVHEAASEWARREATRRVDALADQAASGRSQARALETELAGSVIDLQSTRERLARAAAEERDGLPVQGPRAVRP